VFDTVCHERLLIKLEHYGLRGKALGLLSCYLSDRKQYATINNISSTLKCISLGVPQGLILVSFSFLFILTTQTNSLNQLRDSLLTKHA